MGEFLALKSSEFWRAYFFSVPLLIGYIAFYPGVKLINVCHSFQSFSDFQFTGPEFEFDCPEPNGLFADSQQCDLYYECNSGVATAKLCKDG